eukprot:6188333-Pleurochrysis_carterae.AAC.6
MDQGRFPPLPCTSPSAIKPQNLSDIEGNQHPSRWGGGEGVLVEQLRLRADVVAREAVGDVLVLEHLDGDGAHSALVLGELGVTEGGENRWGAQSKMEDSRRGREEQTSREGLLN